MTNNVLKAMKGAMQEMGMEYAFRRFRKRPEYPYCVGDYLESESMTEDGLQECTFTLTGFARGAGSETVLEAAKNKIRKSLPASELRPPKLFRICERRIAR